MNLFKVLYLLIKSKIFLFFKNFLLKKETNKPLGLALCGIGNYSINELSPALLETKNVKLVAVIDDIYEEGVKLAKIHGFNENNIYSYKEWNRVANNKEIDIVYVVTPPSIHVENVLDAFNAGKNVICEKPMATTVTDCDKMIAASKKACKRLAIGYRLHYDPYHQELVRLAKTQEFGPFMKISSSNGRTINLQEKRDVWRINKKISGGGALLDMGIYCIQACCMAANANPIAVLAKELPKTQEDIFKDIEQSIEFKLFFENGAIADIWTGFDIDREELFAEAEKGWFVGVKNVFYYRNLDISTSSKGKLNFGIFRQQQLYLDAVADAFRNGYEISCSGEIGRRDMIIIEGVYKSIRIGKKVILNYN
jgi:glucose-fructose oxidoreductase